MKNILIIAVVAILLLAGGAWWSSNLKEKKASAEIEGLETYMRANRSHVAGEVAYEVLPPVGGPHQGVWLACNGNIYDEPVINEQAVHSLEHGAVWVTYEPSLAIDQIAALKDKVRGYTFMSPFPGQDAPIILTAWGNQLKVQTAEDPRIDQFIAKFRQGPQTPELGATCFAVPGAGGTRG